MAEGKSVQTTLEGDLAERFDQQVRSEERPSSVVARRALRYYLDHVDPDGIERERDVPGDGFPAGLETKSQRVPEGVGD